MENKELSVADVITFINNCTKKEVSSEDAVIFINRITKINNIDNVIDFIDSCTDDEFKKIRNTTRIYKYTNLIRTNLEDDIDNLKDEISDLEEEAEPSFSKTIDYISNASQRELKRVYDEIRDYLDSESLVANNLYEEDKIKILLTASNKYNLDQLMEKLEITWNDVI